MNLNKTINFNRKYIILLLLLNIIGLSLYYSYALFQVNIIKNGAIVINTLSSIPNITTTIGNTNSNSFTLNGNSSQTITINLNTDNQTITSAIAYKMYYDVTNGYGTFQVTSTDSYPNDKVEGSLTRTKQLTLTFTNSSSNNLTISLGAISGYESTGATLTDQNELVLNTNIIISPPPVTSTQIFSNIHSNNTSSTCQNATLTWTDTADGTVYISGSATCIDFNYVWYSGKLWRIVAKYSDGSMKLVTENAITAIFWGSDVEYDGSYMYQWLNEDFKDTLVSPNTVLKTSAVWNYSTDSSSTPVRPETIATQKTKAATVGLLNAYEYYNSYRCNGSSACTGSTTYGSGYLKNVFWWLITPYSDSRVRLVRSNGNLNDSSPSGNSYGARPSIILQSNIPLSGSGTKNDPYRLVGVDASANVGDNLFSRYSGEYVNFNGEKYRIVSIDENNITKLTKFDYIKNGTTVVTKNFASSSYFKKDGNTQTDTFWDYYLNNNSEGGWLYSIPSTYKNMMVDGTYYLGWYVSSNANYKATVCKDSAETLNSTTINNCTKYTSQDTDKTFTGKVGLPRVGEMFSAQLKVGTNSYSDMWLITPYSAAYVRNVGSTGGVGNDSPSSNARGARPSITLSSSVKIACNAEKCDGTEEYPYDLSCTQCQSQ